MHVRFCVLPNLVHCSTGGTHTFFTDVVMISGDSFSCSHLRIYFSEAY